MKRDTLRRNARKGDASKQIPSRKSTVDVTKTREDSDAVTFTHAESPSKRYAKLEPWFWLANQAFRRSDGRLLPPEATDDSEALTELWGQVIPRVERDESLAAVLRQIQVSPMPDREKDEWLCRLTWIVASTLEFYVERRETNRPMILGGAVLATFQVRDGRVAVNTSDAYRDFMAALDGAEAARIRSCPICRNFFFALRANQKACSKSCNQTRRVREWRSKQAPYEQTRKFKRAGVRPEGQK